MKVESRRINMVLRRRRPIRIGKLNLPGIAPAYCVEWFAGPERYHLAGSKWFQSSTEALAFVKWLRTSPIDWLTAVSSN
jgi:hypothetical protein